MQYYLCVGKKRNNNNVITHYQLRAQNGGILEVDKDELKVRLQAKTVKVINLKMDTQGRLLDCTPQEIEENKREMSSQSNTNQQSNISDEELKQMIEALSNETKGRDTRMMQVLRELYNRNNDLTEQVRSLTHLWEDTNNMGSKIDSILSNITTNGRDIESIKNEIDNMSRNILSNLNNISSNNSGDDGSSNSIIPRDGKFVAPENEYDRALKSNYFSYNDNELCTCNSAEGIEDYLNNVKKTINDAGYDYPIPTSISVELVDKLKDKMDKKSAAYQNAKEFFNTQLTDYKEALNASALLNTLGFIGDKVGQVTNIGAVVGEMGIGVGRAIPGMDNKLDFADYRRKFQEKDKLSVDEALSLGSLQGVIWNNYRNYWANDPDLDIKSYCIESLASLQFNKFLYTVHETPLLDVLEHYKKETYGVKLRVADFEDEVYESVVAAYFAAKELVHETDGGVKPFLAGSTPKTNGKVVALMRVALLMCNIHICFIEHHIGLIVDKLKDKKIKVELDVTF